MKKAKYYDNKKIVMLLVTLLCAIFLIVFVGIQVQENSKESTSAEAVTDVLDIASGVKSSIDNLKVVDDPSIYADDVEDSVVTMYLTVQKGNAAENTNHSWEEINTYSVADYESMGIDRYKVAAILQVGNENGPIPGELGYGVRIPNATVQIRGQTSSAGKQKSYKVKIKDNKGTWNDQTTIVLNKHIYDGVRITNKLCYDLMRQIPGMLSARTQLVHLYVKDETAGGEGEFVDYGLYTQVEQINRTYLRNHGLDKNGHLYKINNFEFELYDEIKLVDDAGYDKKAFETRIETKGDNNHSKLIAMLKDVNDYIMPIEETFEKWFDEDNFFTWLAFHILVGNKDTQSRNVYLYSPINGNKWYFISWDNDDSLKVEEDKVKRDISENSFNKGISNYWGNILFNRILKNPYYRALLDEKIQELRKILTPELIEKQLAVYIPVVKPYIFSLPDAQNQMLTEEEFEQIIAAMPSEVEYNYQIYLDNLKEPMPFFIYPPSIEGDTIVYEWGQSFDLDNEEVAYTFQLGRDYKFNEIIYEEDNLLINKVELDKLETGQYFLRVIATNESLRQQMAFDYYQAEEGQYYGVMCFYVLEDGTIVVDEN